jgi:hypothetical protein
VIGAFYVLSERTGALDDAPKKPEPGPD